MVRPMRSIREINNIDELADIRSDWNALLEQTPGATFFHTLDWLEVYWRHWEDSQQLRTLLVYDADVLIGIVPLVVKPMKTRLGTARALMYPLDDWGTFYGPIGAAAADCLETATDHILNSPRDWDMFDLRFVDTDGDDAGATPTVLANHGLKFETFEYAETALIDLTGNWDDYLASRSGKARQTYLRAERRIAADFEIEFIDYRPANQADGGGDPRFDLYDECEAIAAKSWQGALTDGNGTTLSHEKVRDYFRDCHETAARIGAVEINLIRLDGQPAAFAYNYHYRGCVYSVRIGFDGNITNKGVGRLIMGRMIRNCFEKDDRVLDMGVGTLDCKQYWLTSIETSRRYAHFSRTTPKGQLLRMSRQVSSWFDERFGSSEPADATQSTADLCQS